MNIIVLGISSDIGLALALHWALKGHSVFGTCRKSSEALANASHYFKGIYSCDLLDNQSIDECLNRLKYDGAIWDVLVICSGTMEPIGRFDVCDIDNWCDGITVNLSAPMRFLHKSLPLRRRDESVALPTVLFFAGGGSNSAPLNVSSYTVSKIALIKATELLDAEFVDVKFVILGPGWVRTKIHDETLRATNANDASLRETLRRLSSDDFNSMDSVLACCDWLVAAPKDVVGGRNFSSVHDDWGQDILNQKLRSDQSMFKLRRFGNQ